VADTAVVAASDEAVGRDEGGPAGRLLDALRSLGPLRLVGLIASLAAIVVAVAASAVHLMAPDFVPLFSKLAPEDSAALVRQLEQGRERYQVADGGQTVLVERSRVAQLRILAAERRLPSKGSLGYEVFDKVDPLATTTNLFQINQIRALEGELARTIASIAGVESARVHLVIPTRELFSQQTPDTRASVVVQFRPNMESARQRVESIRHLVASAVKNLSPARVSIVDTQGNLLARGDGETAAGQATAVLEHKLEHERRLRAAVERLVEQHVGFGRVRADVNVDVTYAAVVRTTEAFDPKGRVERSVQTVEEASNKSEQRSDQDLSVQRNVPPEQQTAGQQGTRGSETQRRTEETTNFEVSRTQVKESIDPGSIRRVSVAVLVDGVRQTDASGAQTWRPRGDDELKAIERLVRSAVGFNSERGDSVEIVNLPFSPVELPEIKAPGMFDFTKDDIKLIAQVAVLGIAVALVVLFVVRPIVAKMFEERTSEADALAIEGGGAGALVPTEQVDEVARMKAEIEQEMQALQAQRAQAMAEMIDIDKIEGQVQSSALKRITEIVDKHPEEAASVIRGWLTQRA
jgi:flagellar M-ring protein FliF